MPSDPSESSDPDIRMSYQSIIQEGSLNWLLLSYSKWSTSLKLLAAGSQGLDELKEHILTDEPHFAFVRDSVDGVNYFVIVAYIPDKTSGLRRARAFVTSRTVQSWFKAHQAILTISHLDKLTPSTVMNAVRTRSRRSPSRSPPVIPTPPVARAFSSPPNIEKALPRPPYPSADPVRRIQSASPPSSRFLTPEERARRRQSLQRREAVEDREAVRAEAERQARIKAQKAEILQRSEEEDARRRASLEEELHQRALSRAQREAEEREAEAAREQAKEEKKRADAERRLAETRRVEEWRREEERRLEELARQEALLKALAIEKREAAKGEATQARKGKTKAGETLLLSGWVTIQAFQSLVWRRRYFELADTSLKMYKSDKDTSHPLEVLHLQGAIRSVNEWNEGFEELRAIPHSFGMVFADGQENVSLYTDSDSEKYTLMGYLLTYV